MIKELTLENWTSHRKSTLSFGKGTNVLIGVIGSGKTSIMNALCFALYGTFPALANKKTSIEGVIMQKPLEADSARIELVFEYDGEEYRVERLVWKGKKSSEAKLFKGKQLIAGPKTSEVTERITDILQVDYALFSRAVYAEQNQLDFFLRMTPLERKKRFDELLQISRYEIVRANALRVKNRFKEMCDDRKGWVQELKSRQRIEERVSLEEKILAKEKELSGLSERKRVLGEELEVVRKDLGLEEEKEKKYREKKEECSVLKARIEDARKRTEGIKESLGGLKELLVLEEEKINGFRRELEELREEKARRKSEIASVRSLLKAFKGEKCPVCDSGLSEEKRSNLASEKEKELKALESALGEGREKEVEKALRESEEKVYGLKRKIELKAEEEKISGWAEKLSLAEKELSGLFWEEEKVKGLRKRLSVLQGEKSSFDSNERNSRELLEALRRNLSEMVGREKEIEKFERELKGLSELVEKMTLFVNCLKDGQAELRNFLVDTINHAMGEIWQRIYPYKDYVSAKLLIEEGDYSLKVKQNDGRWVDVEGRLSGGERSAAAIALRTAISLVLTQNLSWLILDEPTHNLDSATVKALSLMLKDHLPGLVEQIFVITHDPEMEKASTGYLYDLVRENNKEGTTIVNRIE